MVNGGPKRVMEMRLLKRMSNIRWDEFKEIKTVLGQFPVDYSDLPLKKTKLEWLGHIERMVNGGPKRYVWGEDAEEEETSRKTKDKMIIICVILRYVSLKE